MKRWQCYLLFIICQFQLLLQPPTKGHRVVQAWCEKYNSPGTCSTLEAHYLHCVTQLKLSWTIFCCLSVCEGSVTPDQISTFSIYTGIKALYWFTHGILGLVYSSLVIQAWCENYNPPGKCSSLEAPKRGEQVPVPSLRALSTPWCVAKTLAGNIDDNDAGNKVMIMMMTAMMVTAMVVTMAMAIEDEDDGGRDNGVEGFSSD